MREVQVRAEILRSAIFAACLAIGLAAQMTPADAKWISINIAGVETLPSGVNDKGVVAGTYLGSDDHDHGFLRAPDGTITSFDAGQSGNTAVAAINTNGTVTGSFGDGGFLRLPDGAITTFAVAGAQATVPAGINDKGAIVGSWYKFDGGYGGFLRTAGGKLKTFSVPGATDTYAVAINGNGVIAGDYVDAKAVPHGFVRNADGSFTTFGIPNVDALYFQTAAIDASGQIVGSYVTDPEHYYSHGFLRDMGGTITVLDLGSGEYTTANGINDGGQIVGGYDNHGFLRDVDGTITTLDYPGADDGTTAISIDKKGKITGNYLGCSAYSFCGFLLKQ
ncbi:MAG TPA: hypothetical protein VNX86_11295 [Rhizomicrobium sp.]|nr:hypothetical protein [Rhizomicrobium sp.]